MNILILIITIEFHTFLPVFVTLALLLKVTALSERLNVSPIRKNNIYKSQIFLFLPADMQWKHQCFTCNYTLGIYVKTKRLFSSWILTSH